MGDVVRRGTKDKPRFYIRYVDSDGKRKQRSARGAKSMSEAREVLAAAELRVTHGKVGIDKPTAEQLARRSITVRDLGEKFMAEYSNPKVKDMKLYRREAKWKLASRINPRIGDRAVASLTVADLERFRDDLGDEKDGKLKPASVTRTLALLSKMFAWGRKVGIIDVDSPTRGCVRPASASSLDYLGRDEVTALLAQAEEFSLVFVTSPEARALYPMLACAIYTGMRKGELFGLRWTDVHLDAARADVARSYTRAPKSGKPRHLPLHPDLVRILRAWRDRCPASKEGLVFPVLSRNTTRIGCEADTLGIAAVLAAAKCHVPDHPWHALRHTFASHYMMAGGNILELQKLLGHSTLAMTMVYAHLAPEHLAAGVARLSFAPKLPAGVANINEERRRRLAELIEKDPAAALDALERAQA
jgi:integrase